MVKNINKFFYCLTCTFTDDILFRSAARSLVGFKVKYKIFKNFLEKKIWNEPLSTFDLPHWQPIFHFLTDFILSHHLFKTIILESYSLNLKILKKNLQNSDFSSKKIPRLHFRLHFRIWTSNRIMERDEKEFQDVCGLNLTMIKYFIPSSTLSCTSLIRFIWCGFSKSTLFYHLQHSQYYPFIHILR